MTENKRYQLRQEQLDYPFVNFCCDLVDTEDNDKVICFFELDAGTRKIVDLLNEKEERIKELEKENEQLRKELDSFEQVSFTDLCDRSRTVLYMKKENVGDVE